jgi:lactate dehydrogenase-like 2-hydroxyacid dehydrogenase
MTDLNKILGIVGFGRIGARLAEMAASAFKMKILYTANSEKINSINARLVENTPLLTRSPQCGRGLRG